MLYMDPEEDRVATPQEACREYVYAVGFDNQAAGREQPAWILTNWDSWERNPFYTGHAVRHPEDDSEPGDDTTTGPLSGDDGAFLEDATIDAPNTVQFAGCTWHCAACVESLEQRGTFCPDHV